MRTTYVAGRGELIGQSELILKRKLKKKALNPQNFTLISLWVHHFFSK